MIPEGYAIRELQPSDAPALAEAYRRNREHLAPYEPRRDESWFTADGQATAIASQVEMSRGGLMVAWLLVAGHDIVGRVNLNNIVRGALRSASVGYWVDVDHLGRGLAVAGVEHACAEALRHGLHRVEAGTLVDNQASQRVLDRCGFEPYGLAPSYLCVGGAWRDHRLFQRLLHDDPV